MWDCRNLNNFVSTFVSGLAAARQQPGNLLLLKVTVLCLALALAQVCITTSRTDTSSCAVIVRMVGVASS